MKSSFLWAELQRICGHFVHLNKILITFLNIFMSDCKVQINNICFAPSKPSYYVLNNFYELPFVIFTGTRGR